MEEEALAKVSLKMVGGDLVEKAEPRTQRGRLASAFWVTLGTISLALGIIGIFLPLIPYTPFFLLTAACYCRGSEKLHTWLLENKMIGPSIKDWEEHRGVRKRAKIISILSLWMMISISIYLFRDIIALQLLLLVVAISVTVFLLSLKTVE